MAALVLRPPHTLDLKQLYSHVHENLPSYARPRFLRLQVTLSCARKDSCAEHASPASFPASLLLACHLLFPATSCP